MRLDVVLAPSEVGGKRFDGQVAVVIDQLRATSTIAAAVVNGCPRIYPVETVEEAFAIRDGFKPEPPLLCGERKGLAIEGFDLGNSPLEYTPEAVGGKPVVLTTTNGTKALRAARGAERLVTCSFANLSAVAGWLCGNEADTIVVCAGRQGRVSLEDAVCAGYLIQRVREMGGEGLDIDDGGSMAEAAAMRYPDPLQALRASNHGRYLEGIGLGADIEWCGMVDRYDVVVSYREGYLSRG